MDITFKNRKLQKIFNSKKLLIKKYGSENAGLIMRRMAVLTAAPTLQDVPFRKPERRHELTGKRKKQFAVDIVHPYRLIFEPNHAVIPEKEDGSIDLARITAITILEVEDYH